LTTQYSTIPGEFNVPSKDAARLSPTGQSSIARARRLAVVLGVAALLISLTPVAHPSTASASGLKHIFTLPLNVTPEFPSGVSDLTEPSGQAPPSATAFPGYVQRYVQDFNGTTVPPDWDVFTGKANGGTGSQWGSAHVVVGGGLLSLNTWQDPAYNNQWVSGGLCMCGAPSTYGAYFVRSRETGPGPTVVELLWPVKVWPPEIDFNETSGVTNQTSATLRYGPGGQQVQVKHNVDMTQWHTWGVIWTPTSVTYTVDGHVWGRYQVPSRVPHAPMTLNIQQQTWCSSNFACPTSPQSTLVDWVSEYKAIPGDPVTIGSFGENSSSLTPPLRLQVATLAERIQAQGDLHVLLDGYSDRAGTPAGAMAMSERRAAAVRSYLSAALKKLGDIDVSITLRSLGEAHPQSTNHSASGRSLNRRVTAHLT
jgi:outer membrane protein OmpA-like peptidoglycan-associated protein